MKFGIVTIFDNTNFGNRLQNFALQEILKHYADEVITIKNKPSPKTTKERIMRLPILAESVLVNKLAGKKRKAEILKFTKKYINVSHKCYYFDKQYTEPIENCDYYCTGSDQIWNPKIGGRINGFNYLDFSHKANNFSFAASFGISEIPENYKQQVQIGLSNFKYISVREEAGLKIVKDLTGRDDAEVLIDPTLYINETSWKKIIKKPKGFSKDKYILNYFLGDVSPSKNQEIIKFAKYHNFKIINVMDDKSQFYNIGPDGFLYLIMNASLVCTDSFHASVFSFIFNRPLAIFMREGDGISKNIGSRLETLMNTFHLNACLVSDGHLKEALLDNNYAEGKKILNQEKNKVKFFLEKVFSTAY